MNYATINPFYAARQYRPTSESTVEPYKPILARLPRAPVTGSPVPHLTSLYHFHRAGEYGDRSYPGNCGGNLIKDLLLYFKPCAGAGPDGGQRHLPRRVRGARHPLLGVGHPPRDSTPATRKASPHAEAFDFIWAHPPYWRQKLYADDPRDLSRAPTLDDFLRRYGSSSATAPRALKPGGKLAILMGDYSDREAGFVPLVYHTKRLAFEAGLRQPCTDIIRFSHGASSSKKVYRSTFIPGLHDVCMVFEKTDRSTI